MNKTGGMVLVALLISSVAYAQTPAAPASAPGQKPAWMEYKTPYIEGYTDISRAHRTSDEITTWAQQTASDLLTIAPAEYQTKMEGFKKYFAGQGWTYYTNYMKDSKFINMLTENQYSSTAVVDDAPEIVNQGTSQGVYHWIVKTPLTISFYSPDPEGFNRTHTSNKYILFTDIGRVPGDDVAIMNWRVDPAAEYAKAAP
jgi:hypothetical protein